MKNSLKFFALAAAVAAFASCEDKIETPVAKADVAPLTINAGSETKTVLRNDADVYWISSDVLSVFDNEYNCYGFQNTSADATPQTDFVYDSWPSGKTPEFAVYCYTSDGATQPSFNGNKATAFLYATQRIYNKKSYAKYTGLSVGEIAYDGENYSVEEMKNCYALIQFKVKNSDILSIHIQGTNNEQLGGWVDIDYSKIKPIGEDNHADPFWTGSEGKTQDKTIKLDITGSGGTTSGDKKVFDNTSYYYIAVLPQVVQGLSFKVKKVDGTEDTQVINGPITLNRSKIKKLKHPVDSALFNAGPEDKIVLDCTDATKFKRTVEGESEPQMLPVRTPANGAPYDFWLEGYESYIFHGYPYRWQTSYFCVKSGLATTAYPDNDKVKLPNISGYTLSEMKVTAQYSSQSPNYKITDGTTTLASASINKTSSTFPVVFDVSAHPQSSTSPNRYLVVTGEGNIKFTLTYSKVSE